MAERLPFHQRLGTRLGAAFSLTAATAVALATLLAVVAATGGVSTLVAQQRDDTVRAVGEALAAAYVAAGGWAEADLLPAHTLAASAGAVLVVEGEEGEELPVPPGADAYRERIQRGDRNGADDGGGTGGTGGTGGRTERPRDGRGRGGVAPAPDGTPVAVAMTLAFADDPDPGPSEADVEEERTFPVVADGEEVGSATLLFVGSASPGPAELLRQALTRNLVLAGVVAALLGIVVAAWVAPRLTRPLRRLTDAVDRLAHGDRAARAELPGAVGELGVLARSVDRMADDLEREDRLRRALVADLAHEVRTPLTVLLGEVEALQDGVVEPGAAELASLREEVLRLAGFIDDLDAIAAAEAAGLDLRHDPVDLAEVARAALSGLAEQLAGDGLEVDADLLAAPVEGDARRLEQVVRNLLTNAAKFSPPGGRITLAVAPAGGSAVIEVVDDGPGIPADERPHVFERFWRGAAADRVPGSGIGLAVVAELAAAHGGTVAVDDAPGRGACFVVSLPLARIDATV